MPNLNRKLAVNPKKLQYHLDNGLLKKMTFEKIQPLREIIGQDRALSAMELGLEMKSKGYNIFVTGLPGTGRTTAVKILLQNALAGEKRRPKDICYVNNFKMAECPMALYFPAGEGRKFKKAIAYLIDSLVTVIPKILSGQSYKERRGRIIKEFDARQKDLYLEFERKLKDKKFALVQLQFGPAIRPDLQPIIEGQPVAMIELEKAVEEGKFSAEDMERLRTEYDELSKELMTTSEQSRKITGNLEQELDRLDSAEVVPLINDKIDTLKKLYNDDKVHQYLDDLKEVLMELLSFFRSSLDERGEPADMERIREQFSQFTVNLLVDNSEQKAPPVVIEDFPSYKNLFGSIERVYDPSGGWHTDFTRIRSGSMIRANGGYLVLQALDIFTEPQVWPTLKRTLRTGRLTISNIDTLNLQGSGLKPEPLELDVKVVLIGHSRIYDILYDADGEFKKVFKIKAEFDSVMPNNSDNVLQYARFVKRITEDAKLPPLDGTGLAAITEYGVKLTGRRDRLSTRFTQISDLVREAGWLARKQSKKKVNREMIRQAILLQKKRVNLVETKVQEMYEREVYLLDISGWKVGQINGLSVYDLGEYAFGRPTRITASVSPGADGVINIEREAAMAGRVYNKGVLILSGFMRHRFGRRRPLVFSASLCFEQSYGGVDGDSASSTEIYALLSALSDKPINQALAVTGSVNQKGEVQPIGGVNEKIEGYFDVCMIDGLTGEQGVLIPVQNVQELMLKDEVVDAVEKKKFHIYAISHIDEGIEILTGFSAGRLQKDGHFQKGTINYFVDQRLSELAEIWKEYISSRSGR